MILIIVVILIVAITLLVRFGGQARRLNPVSHNRALDRLGSLTGQESEHASTAVPSQERSEAAHLTFRPKPNAAAFRPDQADQVFGTSYLQALGIKEPSDEPAAGVPPAARVLRPTSAVTVISVGETDDDMAAQATLEAPSQADPAAALGEDPPTAAVPLAAPAEDPPTAAVPLAAPAEDPPTAAIPLVAPGEDPPTQAVPLVTTGEDPATAAIEALPSGAHFAGSGSGQKAGPGQEGTSQESAGQSADAGAEEASAQGPRAVDQVSEEPDYSDLGEAFSGLVALERAMTQGTPTHAGPGQPPAGEEAAGSAPNAWRDSARGHEGDEEAEARQAAAEAAQVKDPGQPGAQDRVGSRPGTSDAGSGTGSGNNSTAPRGDKTSVAPGDKTSTAPGGGKSGETIVIVDPSVAAAEIQAESRTRGGMTTALLSAPDLAGLERNIKRRRFSSRPRKALEHADPMAWEPSRETPPVRGPVHPEYLPPLGHGPGQDHHVRSAFGDPPPPPRRRRGRRPVSILGALVLLAIIGLIVHSALSGGSGTKKPKAKTAATTASPTSTTTQVQQTSTTPILLTHRPGQATYSLPSSSSLIRVAVNAPCWIQINRGSKSGKLYYTATMKTGQVASISGPSYVELGNPKAATVTVGGTVIHPPYGTHKPFGLVFKSGT